MKILITGIHGLIGSFFLKKFKQHPEIFVFSTGRQANKEQDNYLQIDLVHPIKCPLPHNLDFVIHCAGMGLLKMIKSRSYDCNEKMLLHLIEGLQKAEFKGRIIYLSTIKTLETKLVCQDPYIQAKKRCEDIIEKSSLKKQFISIKLPLVFDKDDPQLKILLDILKFPILPFIKDVEVFSSFIDLASIYDFVLNLIEKEVPGNYQQYCLEAREYCSWNSIIKNYIEVTHSRKILIKVKQKKMIGFFSFLTRFYKTGLIFGKIPLQRIYDIFYHSWRYRSETVVNNIIYDIKFSDML